MSTGTTTRRGRKPNPHTRDNLIKVGLRSLYESGYAATGIKEIVDGADVPKGSFYNHFDSKEAFGAEVVDTYFSIGLVELRAILQDEQTPPLDRLRKYFDERIRRFEDLDFTRGCLLGNLSLEVADHSDAIRTRIAAHFATWGELFESCIAEAQSSGAIGTSVPPDVLGRFLLNSWEGALVRMKAEKDVAPLRDFKAIAFGVLLV